MIEKLLDEHLEKENSKPRKRSGKFSPSSFHQCYRRQIYNRRNEPQTNPPNERALRIFKIGNIVHEYLQKLIPNHEQVCEVKFENENFIGFADHVGDNYIEDFKTVGSFKFKQINVKNAVIDVNCRDYILQLMTYCYFMDKPIGKLTFVNKDDWQIKTFEFKLEDYKDKVEMEMNTLMNYWSTKTLPPATPRLYHGKECMYCNFKGLCKSTEKEKKETSLSARKEK
jgi:hypothetical protein